MDNTISLARLRWQCRRGMLELDVLLGNFLERRYMQLEKKEQQLFMELLTYPDTELLAWFMGHQQPEDVRLVKIIGKIKKE